MAKLQEVEYLIGPTWNVLRSHAMLVASQGQGWSWPWIWWICVVMERGIYERELLEYEGSGSLTHWAMHHGIKFLVPLVKESWKTYFIGGSNYSTTDTISFFSYHYVVGLVAMYLLYRCSGSPALLSFVLSRALFSSPRISNPYTARNLLFDSEWTWYIMSHNLFSLPGTRWYISSLAIIHILLHGRLVADLLFGTVHWRNLLPFKFIFAWCLEIIYFLFGKPTMPVRYPSKPAVSSPATEEIGRNFYLYTKDLDKR